MIKIPNAYIFKRPVEKVNIPNDALLLLYTLHVLILLLINDDTYRNNGICVWNQSIANCKSIKLQSNITKACVMSMQYNNCNNKNSVKGA